MGKFWCSCVQCSAQRESLSVHVKSSVHGGQVLGIIWIKVRDAMTLFLGAIWMSYQVRSMSPVNPKDVPIFCGYKVSLRWIPLLLDQVKSS